MVIDYLNSLYIIYAGHFLMNSVQTFAFFAKASASYSCLRDHRLSKGESQNVNKPLNKETIKNAGTNGLINSEENPSDSKTQVVCINHPKKANIKRLKMRKRTSVVVYAHIYNDQFHGPVLLRVPLLPFAQSKYHKAQFV